MSVWSSYMTCRRHTYTILAITRLLYITRTQLALAPECLEICFVTWRKLAPSELGTQVIVFLCHKPSLANICYESGSRLFLHVHFWYLNGKTVSILSDPHTYNNNYKWNNNRSRFTSSQQLVHSACLSHTRFAHQKQLLVKHIQSSTVLGIRILKRSFTKIESSKFTF